VCLFVCVSVREHIRELHVQSTPIFCACHMYRGSVLLWRRCDKLCTSGFTDDVIFAHNGPYEGMSIPLQRVMSLRRRAKDNAPVASYWPRRVDSSPR